MRKLIVSSKTTVTPFNKNWAYYFIYWQYVYLQLRHGLMSSGLDFLVQQVKSEHLWVAAHLCSTTHMIWGIFTSGEQMPQEWVCLLLQIRSRWNETRAVTKATTHTHTHTHTVSPSTPYQCDSLAAPVLNWPTTHKHAIIIHLHETTLLRQTLNKLAN